MKLEKIAFVFIGIAVVGTFVFFANTTNSVKLASSVKGANNTKFTGPASGKKMVFSDDFYGTTLNLSNWSTCYDWRKPSETGCTNSGNLEQEWYTSSQVKVKAGVLYLTAINLPIDVAVQGQAKSFSYQSGMINSGPGSTNSKAHWVGTYGYFESRIKVQKGQGVWPAFWLLPADRNWPPEIDVMEFLGNKPGEILQTLHWEQDAKPAKDETRISKTIDYSNNWHTYGVDWQPGKIDWYIDGVKTKTFEGKEVPSEPMEIIINLAIGGTLPGNADGSTPFPRQMQVDYVRVFQTKDQLRPVNS